MKIIVKATALALAMALWVVFGALATQHELDRVEAEKPKVCRTEFGRRKLCDK